MDGAPSAGGPQQYRERLWPSPGIWLVTLLLGLALGLAPLPVSAAAAVVTAVVAVVALVTALVATTPSIEVGPGTFRAGRAVVDRELVGAVEPLDAEEMRQARGRRLDARAYLCMRGWIPTGVRVVLDDPDDPTPYWLVSSRRPRDLAAALAPVQHGGPIDGGGR